MKKLLIIILCLIGIIPVHAMDSSADFTCIQVRRDVYDDVIIQKASTKSADWETLAVLDKYSTQITIGLLPTDKIRFTVSGRFSLEQSEVTKFQSEDGNLSNLEEYTLAAFPITKGYETILTVKVDDGTAQDASAATAAKGYMLMQTREKKGQLTLKNLSSTMRVQLEISDTEISGYTCTLGMTDPELPVATLSGKDRIVLPIKIELKDNGSTIKFRLIDNRTGNAAEYITHTKHSNGKVEGHSESYTLGDLLDEASFDGDVMINKLGNGTYFLQIP